MIVVRFVFPVVVSRDCSLLPVLVGTSVDPSPVGASVASPMMTVHSTEPLTEQVAGLFFGSVGFMCTFLAGQFETR